MEQGRPSQPPLMAPVLASVPDSRDGSEIDVTAAFENHFDYVWFTLRRLGVAERDLEDVTHDVFVHVYKQRDKYDPVRPVRPWLFGFAYRVASDYRRLARNRYESLDDDVESIDSAPSPADRLMTKQQLELVWAALQELDIDRRAVFLLHEVEGCQVTEVAAALEIPLNTAYSRLRLAREQFTKAVERLRSRRGET
jgi:RNA polymerase sigma-70 factor (ECF subfamily)